MLVADGFRCKRCDGIIKEADLAGHLVVDGETYGCVKSFCYLRDTLDGNCCYSSNQKLIDEILGAFSISDI